MKLLGRIFDFYLDASIHVALAVFCLIFVTTIFLNIQADMHLAWSVFFGSIAAYNFVKYGAEAEKYILVANNYHKNIQSFSFVALGLAAYHAYFFSLELWITLAILLFLTALYTLPVLPQAKNLRSLGLVKVVLVATVWAGTTVVLPVIAAKQGISWDVLVETIQRFLLVLVLILPFEVRDIKYDAPELGTMPQRYGVANTKVFGAFTTVAFFFLTFLKDDISRTEIIGKGILFLMLGMMMYTTKRNQSRYFASFWVEAVPIFWFGILWVLEKYV